MDADYQFYDQDNPWTNFIDESVKILDTENDVDADFIGVKIGDVNGSVISNANNVAIQSRSQRWPLVLEIEETELNANHIIRIPVFASNYENVTGWQGTFSFNPTVLEIIDIKPSEILNDKLEINMHQVQKLSLIHI